MKARRKQISIMDEKDYQILTDEDVYRLLGMQDVIKILEETFRQKAKGNLSSPPRIYVEGGQGALAFTVGASPSQERGLGFRVYSMFKNATERNKQLVAVFDSDTGAFKGAVIGTAVGDLRTGAIGGIAIKYLSRPDARVLGMIGTGTQAVTQLEAAVEVRKFETVLVFSRKTENRLAFARRMSNELKLDVQAVDTAKAAVEPADVLICATISPSPVFDPGWIKPGTHITTIGPKLTQSHELPIEAALGSTLISTDSLAQIEDFGERYFLKGHVPISDFIPLSDIIIGNHSGRSGPEEQTLFCSTGLAGTEVVVASHALSLNQA